MDIFKGLRYLA